MRVPSQHDTSDGQHASSLSFTSFGHLTHSQSRPIAAKPSHSNSCAYNSSSYPDNPETLASPPSDIAILSGSLSTSPPVFVSPPHRISMTSTSSTGSESRPQPVSEPPGLEFPLPLLPGEYAAFLGATRDTDLQLSLTNYRFAVTALNASAPTQSPAAATASAAASAGATPSLALGGTPAGVKATATAHDAFAQNAATSHMNGASAPPQQQNGLLGPLARNAGGASAAQNASGVGMGLAIVPLGLIEQCNTDMANSLLVINCRDLRIIK